MDFASLATSSMNFPWYVQQPVKTYSMGKGTKARTKMKASFVSSCTCGVRLVQVTSNKDSLSSPQACLLELKRRVEEHSPTLHGHGFTALAVNVEASVEAQQQRESSSAWSSVGGVGGSEVGDVLNTTVAGVSASPATSVTGGDERRAGGETSVTSRAAS